MIHPLIAAAEAGSRKTDDDLPSFAVGDDVDVYYRIVEGEGAKRKPREQRFTGTVIQIKGRGATQTFTVRRIVAGEGVERVFPYHSPNVARVDVKRSGRTRRARLFYLRDRVGKATRLVEKTPGRIGKQGGGSGGTASGNKADKGAQKREQAANKKQELADSPEVANASANQGA